MLEDPEQALTIAVVLGFFSMLLIAVIIGINIRKQFVNKRILYYVYVPLMALPTAVVMTYIFLSESVVNFVVRLLIALGMVIVAFASVFIYMLPLIEKTIRASEKQDEPDR
jgi:hypothetical protein